MASSEGRCRPSMPAAAKATANSTHSRGWAKSEFAHQRSDDEAHGALGEPDHAAAVDRVRESSADEGCYEQGDELSQAQQADDEGRVAYPVRLVGQGDVGHHAPEEGDPLTEEQQAELPRAPERGEVDPQHGGEAVAGLGRGLPTRLGGDRNRLRRLGQRACPRAFRCRMGVVHGLQCCRRRSPPATGRLEAPVWLGEEAPQLHGLSDALSAPPPPLLAGASPSGREICATRRRRLPTSRASDARRPGPPPRRSPAGSAPTRSRKP